MWIAAMTYAVSYGQKRSKKPCAMRGFRKNVRNLTLKLWPAVELLVPEARTAGRGWMAGSRRWKCRGSAQREAMLTGARWRSARTQMNWRSKPWGRRGQRPQGEESPALLTTALARAAIWPNSKSAEQASCCSPGTHRPSHTKGGEF